MIDISAGVFWMMATVIGVALLGIALAWGVARTARRNRRQDAVTEAAVREQYDHPNVGDKSATANPDERLGAGR